ncbi:MAG: protein kinase [Limisphaerales bacterium]
MSPSDGPPPLPRHAVPPPLPRHAVADSQREPAAPPADLLAHLEERGYKVFERIGSGGFAHVYKGYDVRHQRYVALKVLRSEASEVAAKRFKDESVLLAKCNHPNIVRIYDSGEYEGSPFLVVELVASPAGRSSPRTLTELKETPEGWARLFATLARALQTAHDAKLTHRDLKPENILLRGETKEPVIVDFGMARDANRLIDGNVTRGFAGTPSYMAPEQVLEARRKHVGPATDQWALGVLLYEVLTGRRPFDVSREDHEILAAICNPEFEPEPPRQRMPALPRALEAICLKCLHRDPDFRYASMASLANDLELFLSIGQSLAEAEVLTPTRRVLKKTTLLVRRHWVATAAIAGLAGIMCVVVAYVLLYKREVMEYYSSYVLRWGVPHGISPLTESEVRRREGSYMLVREGYRGRIVALVNINGHEAPDGSFVATNDGHDEMGTAAIEVRYDAHERGTNSVRELRYLDFAKRELLRRSYDETLEVIRFTRGSGKEAVLASPTPTVRDSSFAGDSPTFISSANAILVSYDRNGFEVTNLFVDQFLSPALDANGAGGVAWRRDDSGRKIEQWWLGTNAEPSAASDGVARETWQYDATGNLVTNSVFGLDGKPVLNRHGVAMTRIQYDSVGNWTNRAFFGVDGKPVQNIVKIAGMSLVRDRYGREIQRTYVGTDGRPTLHAEGAARRDLEYGEFGSPTTVRFFNLNGDPVGVKDSGPVGVLHYNQTGDFMGGYSRGVDGRGITNRYGVAREIPKLDRQGRIVELTFADASGRPMVNSDGVGLLKMEYDKWGVISREYFGASNQPVTVYGVHLLKVTRNPQGRLTGAAFFGVDGQPAYHASRPTRSTMSYHSDGKVALRTYDMLAAGEGGVASTPVRVSIQFDLAGNETELSHRDPMGNAILCLYRPVASDAGRVGTNGVSDSFEVEGLPGKITLSRQGYAVRQSRYDAKGRLLEERFLGTNLALVVPAPEGYARAAYSYSGDGDGRRTVFYDAQDRELQQAALIRRVQKSSYAETLGLLAGDIVLSVGDKAVAADSPLETLMTQRAVPTELTLRRGASLLRFSVGRRGLIGIEFRPIARPAE